jgi:tetratricopeptide (TPR) repeat protein
MSKRLLHRRAKTNANNTGSVVVSPDDSISRQKKHRRAKFILTIIFLVVIAITTVALIKHHDKQQPVVVTTGSGPAGLNVYQKQLQSAETDAESSKSAGTYSALGDAYFNNAKYQQAVQAYQQAIHVATNASDKTYAMNGLAYAFAANHQKQDAINEFNLLVSELKASTNSADQAQVTKYDESVKILQDGGSL